MSAIPVSHPRRQPELRRLAPIGLVVGLLCAAAANAQPRWDVTSRDGLVTILANAATAADIAAAIGDATGVAVIVHGEPSTPLSANIVDEPLDKAIAQLSPSHMLVRDGDATDSEIIEVVLMMPDPASSAATSTEFLPSGAPAPEVVDGGTADTGINADPSNPDIQNGNADAIVTNAPGAPAPDATQAPQPAATQ